MTVRGSLPLRRGVPRDATFTLQDALTFPIAAGEATVVRLVE